MATENDSLNGVAMLFGHLLTGTAQVFADVRTYWSPAAVKRVTGYDLTGAAAGGLIHLINSGAAALDGSGRQKIDGQPAMKPFWEITEAEAQACLDATTWHPAITEYFRGGGFSSHFVTARRHADHHVARQPGAGPGPGAADRRRLDGRPARRSRTTPSTSAPTPPGRPPGSRRD